MGGDGSLATIISLYEKRKKPWHQSSGLLLSLSVQHNVSGGSLRGYGLYGPEPVSGHRASRVVTSSAWAFTSHFMTQFGLGLSRFSLPLSSAGRVSWQVRMLGGP